MKRTISHLLVVVLLLCCFVPITARAEGRKYNFNWEDYSLEDLLAIRDEISEVIENKQRQYAIEHGDRTISLPDEVVVYVGGQTTVEAIVEKTIDSAPDKTELIWTSSDDSIVVVSNQGVISGKSEGEAVVSCRAADNEYIIAELSVKSVLPVSSVSLSEEKATVLLYEGKETGLQLDCTVYPDGAYCKDVDWISSNASVATVDENGYVSFLSAGNVTITAKSKDAFSEKRPKEARCVITVLQAVSEIKLDQESIVMNKGSAAVLKASLSPLNAGNKTVLWESSDPSIVSVKNGQLKALACGSATITCTASDGSGAKAVCEVDVIQMVTGIKFKDIKSPITLDRWESQQLTVDILPLDATDMGVFWESSDKSVVSVSENGKIVAQAHGTATVTCTAADGSGKKASVIVNVPSISIKEDQYVVTSKDGMDFNVSFYGENGDFEIAPLSNAFFRVSQSQSGSTVTIKIVPLKAGKANITLKDKADSKSSKTVTIVIDHNAVYDTVAYPVLNYSDIMRYPDQFNGKCCSFYGKVLQITESGGFLSSKKLNLRVGTAGYGFYDKVYWVTIDPSILDTNLIEDDMITIYGNCSGTYTYTAIFGNSITIPAVTAERVIFGRN